MTVHTEERCGYVALIGRPNVGKSTLLNHLLGQKISITSRKPQTTRHRLLGIKTEDAVQIVYVDTPGIHQQKAHAMNRYLNRTATTTLMGVDVVVWLVEALQWTAEDEHVLEHLQGVSVPVILCVNKVDMFSKKADLLPFMEKMSAHYSFTDIFPISALKIDNLAELENGLIKYLPQQAHIFPEDQITDRSERFLVAEIVREKLMRRLGDELPYQLTVEVENFKEEGDVAHIGVLIWVERKGQKAIVIGKGGSMLKNIGQSARLDIEKMLERRVFLQLWVKVREGWYDNERSLRQLGYDE